VLDAYGLIFDVARTLEEYMPSSTAVSANLPRFGWAIWPFTCCRWRR
jgi:hypothetical protein